MPRRGGVVLPGAIARRVHSCPYGEWTRAGTRRTVGAIPCGGPRRGRNLASKPRCVVVASAIAAISLHWQGVAHLVQRWQHVQERDQEQDAASQGQNRQRRRAGRAELPEIAPERRAVGRR